MPGGVGEKFSEPASAVVPAWSITEGVAVRVTMKGRTVIVTVSVSSLIPSETLTWKIYVAPATREGALKVGWAVSGLFSVTAGPLMRVQA